ncbi:MAG: penicillin-binding protein 2 [Candidatus Portiera sp.]|nr:penicillin-binding protein 2 [Portiera sp.]
MALLLSREITNQAQENRIFKVRLKIITVLLVFSFALILMRVGYLQIINRAEQVSRSDAYHIRFRAIPPERGLIYDSQGQVLAGNRLSYALYINPLKIDKSIDLLVQDISDLVGLQDESIDDFYKDISRGRRHNKLFLLHKQLTEEEIARIMVNRYRLPGIEIQPQFQRFYPLKEIVSHVIGHTGRITEEDQLIIDEFQYRGLDSIGKLGVEAFYEQSLKGESGTEEVGVNAYGRVVEVYRQQTPTKGNDVKLWLDSDLQEFVWTRLGNRTGAVIVADTKSGGILSMVSKPSYDNNLFVTGISQKEFDVLRLNKKAPLLNRAAAGRYPPGSTIKPFYAITALKNKVVTPGFKIFDKGYFKLPNSDIVFRNWKRRGHGKVNLRRAIRVSSDTYFYTLANLMGYEIMREGLQSFGFGKTAALDVHNELNIALPDSSWKINHYNLPWFPGDTINMGIGQGYLVSSPMQLITGTLILANRGKDVRPRLVKSVGGEDIYPPVSKIAVATSNSHWDLVHAGMEDVLHSKEGTAKRAGKGAPYKIAGKTGTSQVVSLRFIEEIRRNKGKVKEEWLDHASFIGFVPASAPKYAIIVVLENGGSGSKAALLAREIMDYLIVGIDKVGLLDGN